MTVQEGVWKARSGEIHSGIIPAHLSCNAPGARLGAYEITGQLGAGGMGEVYRARDPRLKRDIALKILPPALATDPERRLRFEREAQAIAALNHPGIVTIYSVEQVDGQHLLTMELVEGRSLADLIPRQGLPLERFLQIAIPLADAVSAAHEKGITHRDLKPANVMVTPEGRVKVLDFGLAKLRPDAAAADGAAGGPNGLDVTRAATGEPTLVSLTGTGLIVGTVAYMSPEQAEGRAVDHRTDLFSLGVVFYEMATGERPFKGDTNLSVLAAIVRDTPRPVTALNPAIPGELTRIIRGCLQKDPERRYQAAKDLRNDLDTLKEDVSSGALVTPAPRPRPRRFRAGGIGLTAAVVGLGALVGGYALWLRSEAPPGTAAGPVQATFTQLTSQAGVERYPSLSPDGRWFVYVSAASGSDDIYLQSVGGQNAINLTKDSPASDTQPAFSPDGERLAFRSERNGGGIFVMGRTGEGVRRVAAMGFNPAWSPDGREMVVSSISSYDRPFTGDGNLQRAELWVVQVETGEKRLLHAPPAGWRPRWSPDGRWIAFQGAGPLARLLRLPSTGGAATPVLDDAANFGNPVWAPDGHALYAVSDGAGSPNVWRVPVDPDTGRASGPAATLAAPAPTVNDLTVSADGRRVAYVALQTRSNIEKRAFDSVSGRAGREAAWVTNGSKAWGRHLDVSPDGAWIAFSSDSVADLYVVRSDGSGLQQLTSDPASDSMPRWSPDGRHILFNSTAGSTTGGTIGQVWQIDPDGSGRTQLSRSDRDVERPFFVSQGSRLVSTVHEAGETVVVIWDPAVPWADQRVERLAPGAGLGNFHCLDVSPDGRRLACASPTGHFVYSLETRESRKITDQVQGPVMPGRWLDSRRLLLPDGPLGSRLMLIDVDTNQVREVLSVAPDRLRNFALSPDRRWLYLSRGPDESDIWLAELKEPGTRR